MGKKKEKAAFEAMMKLYLSYELGFMKDKNYVLNTLGNSMMYHCALTIANSVIAQFLSKKYAKKDIFSEDEGEIVDAVYEHLQKILNYGTLDPMKSSAEDRIDERIKRDIVNDPNSIAFKLKI